MGSKTIKIALGVLFLAFFCWSTTEAIELFNDTDDTLLVTALNRHGKVVYIDEQLMRKLKEEEQTWHMTPWLRTRVLVEDNVVREAVCLTSDSIESFPDGLFDDDQLRKGAFLLYVLFGIYAFTLLAIVCNDFFIPCVEAICEDLNIPQNVAAATFMAVATSCPEFFVNVISTFLTESDMGVGTIVGSAIFNALGVAAIGSLAAIRPIKIERRPVTRDVLIYMFNVIVLVLIVWDGVVEWGEAVVLGVLYVLYFVIMFNSMRLFALYDKLTGCICKKKSTEDIVHVVDNGARISIEEGVDNKGFSDVPNDSGDRSTTVDKVENDEPEFSLWRFPHERSVIYKIWWLYSWPLNLLLGFTIPSPVKRRKLYPLAFIMCIIWIGANSYCVSWSMTVIGHTFFIPDSVMGMTFLAFGGCLPEACSVFIMSQRGEGGIGVSNALGANSLAILFALGLPWLIKTLTLLAEGADNPVVLINSAGIDFVIGSLLVAVVSLWIILFIGKFTLRRSIGYVLCVLYIIFITFAILVEMGIILDRGIDLFSC